MATEMWQLTDDERALIDRVYHSNVLDDEGWARVFERVKRAPRREGAIESAFMDEGLWSRTERNLYGIATGFADPSIGIEAAKEHFEQKGIVGGLADIAWQSATTPVRAIGSVATGQGLGENPIETVVGIASVIPVGRLATAGLGAGLKSAGKVAAATKLSDIARSPKFTAAARGVEVGDVVAGAEEWPLEVIGEGMMEGGALTLSHLARMRRADAEDVEEAPEIPITPDTRTFTPQPAPEQPAPETAREPQTRQYELPNTDISITVKRVPNSDGNIDNRHWQVYFQGTDVEESIGFTTEDDVTSYEGARDAAIQQLITASEALEIPITPDTRTIVPPEQAAARQNREAKRAENRQARQDKREGIETDEDPNTPDAAQTPVKSTDAASTQETEEVSHEEQAADLKEQTDSTVEYLTEWIIQHGEPDDTIEEVVEQSFIEGINQGSITDADAKAIYPEVLARVQEAVPILRAEYEAAEARTTEINQQIDDNIGNVKYKKADSHIALPDGSLIDVPGYTVEGTGLDEANIFIYKDQDNWKAVNQTTGEAVEGEHKTRVEAARAAMFDVLAEQTQETEPSGITDADGNPILNAQGKAVTEKTVESLVDSIVPEVIHQEIGIDEAITNVMTRTTTQDDNLNRTATYTDENIEALKPILTPRVEALLPERRKVIEAKKAEIAAAEKAEQEKYEKPIENIISIARTFVTALENAVSASEVNIPRKYLSQAEDLRGTLDSLEGTKSKSSIIKVAQELWRLSRVADTLQEREGVNVENIENIRQEITDLLDGVGLRIVDVTGTRYDAGVAATPVNIEDFGPDDELVIRSMISPIIMEGTELAATGTVILAKKETPDAQPPTETDTTETQGDAEGDDKGEAQQVVQQTPAAAAEGETPKTIEVNGKSYELTPVQESDSRVSGFVEHNFRRPLANVMDLFDKKGELRAGRLLTQEDELFTTSDWDAYSKNWHHVFLAPSRTTQGSRYRKKDRSGVFWSLDDVLENAPAGSVIARTSDSSKYYTNHIRNVLDYYDLNVGGESIVSDWIKEHTSEEYQALHEKIDAIYARVKDTPEFQNYVEKSGGFPDVSELESILGLGSLVLEDNYTEAAYIAINTVLPEIDKAFNVTDIGEIKTLFAEGKIRELLVSDAVSLENAAGIIEDGKMYYVSEQGTETPLTEEDALVPETFDEAQLMQGVRDMIAAGGLNYTSTTGQYYGTVEGFGNVTIEGYREGPDQVHKAIYITPYANTGRMDDLRLELEIPEAESRRIYAEWSALPDNERSLEALRGDLTVAAIEGRQTLTEPETPLTTGITATKHVNRMADSNAKPEMKLQIAIAAFLSNPEAGNITAEDLFAAATAAWGERTYNSQQVYDVLEVAVNQYLQSATDKAVRQDIVTEIRGPELNPRKNLLDVNVSVEKALENVAAIQAVEARLPRQADRTAEREQNQQYSTPHHYAYLVNWVANLQSSDIVLEPSAGTGNLAWHSKQADAEVHVNDIGKFRYQLLSENFVNASKVDAVQIDKRLPNVKPTLVVMNPPFSQTQKQGDKKNQLLGVNMVESALKALQPGGRLVAIVGGGRDLTDKMIAGDQPGGGPNFNAKTYRKWWTRIGNNYLIRANVHVSGEVYKGFGTTFNTRLLVIDKPNGENPEALRDADGNLKPIYEAMQKVRVDSVAEAIPLLEEVRNGRTDVEQKRAEPTRQAPTDADRPGGPRISQPEGDTQRVVSPSADAVVSQPTGSDVSPSESVDATGETQRTDVRPESETGVAVAELGQEPPSDPASDDTETGGDRSDRSVADATVRRDDGTGASRADDGDTRDIQIDAGATWVPTTDTHVVKGQAVNLMETVSLATISSPDVANILINIPGDFLDLYSNAQKKGIRLILRAHDGFIEPEVVGDTPLRRGFYVGDDTGTGKTWIISGILNHYMNEGKDKHILITQTQDLINDFMEAFPLGGGDVSKTFNINDTQRSTGLMISTYSTLAGKEGDNTRLSEMLEFATGRKPPESLLRPQTNNELLMFGELPRTFALAYRVYDAGGALPTEVADIMSRFEQESKITGKSETEAGDAWTNQYDAILDESQALLKAEGGISPKDWLELAKQFDGVIAFDESHLMKNDKSTKEKDASATARKGKLLAKLLPNARVVYASATGTTEIGNYSYMERLGIWGRDKPFVNANAFIMEMERGGIASQEVVARDLKAKGLFVSRSQDFSGVVVRSLIHDLSEEQVEMYNDFANVWQQVRLYLMDYQASIEELREEAGDEGGKPSAKGVGIKWSNFYNKQQTFFKAMLATFKMQSVIPDMIKQVDAGKKVTMQVVSTYEANQKRQEQRAQRMGIDVSDIEITAREILEEYLDPEHGALPIYSHEVIVDAETGEKVVREIINETGEIMELDNGMTVAPNQPIPNMELVAKRDALIDLLYRRNLPPPPIDQVIQTFKERDIEVAEITGRKKRYYFNKAGERVLETLKPTKTRDLAKRFNENELRVLIFSRKGSTGANYPATDINHPIVQYVIDIGWEADKFKQSLGRSKRSNQVAEPEIVNTATNMVGELRFQSTAASRAAEMGATTRGQAQEGTGLDLFTFDAKYLNSDYGKKALFSFLYELYRGYTFEVPDATNPDGTPLRIGWSQTPTTESFLRVTGIEVKEDSKGRLDFYRVSVNQFLNRVLGAPSIAIQNALYNQFFRRLSNLLEEAEANGTLDKGVETMDTLSANIQDDYTIYTDPDSGAETLATSVAIEQEPNYIQYNEVKRLVDYFRGEGDRIASFFVRNDGQIFFDQQTASRTDESGKIIQRIKRSGPRGSIRFLNLKDAYTADEGTRYILNDISDEQIETLGNQWQAELDTLSPTRKSVVTLVRGLMIDVWDKINPQIYGRGDSEAAARELARRKLVRIILDDNTNIIGRVFSDINDFRAMLTRFGIEDAESIGGAKQVINAVEAKGMIEDGWTLELTGGFTLRQRTRANQPYLAVEGETAQLEALVSDNVLQKVRPSGGRVTYVLPNASLTNFLRQYRPSRALRRNDIVDLTYEDDITPPTTPDDEGGGTPPAQGGTPNVEPTPQPDPESETPETVSSPVTPDEPAQPTETGETNRPSPIERNNRRADNFDVKVQRQVEERKPRTLGLDFVKNADQIKSLSDEEIRTQIKHYQERLTHKNPAFRETAVEQLLAIHEVASDVIQAEIRQIPEINNAISDANKQESEPVQEDDDETQASEPTSEDVPVQRSGDATPVGVGDRPAKDYATPPPSARAAPARSVHVDKDRFVATDYLYSEEEVKAYVIDNLDSDANTEPGNKLEISGEGLESDQGNFVTVTLETPKSGYQLVLAPRREAPIVRINLSDVIKASIDNSNISLKEVIRRSVKSAEEAEYQAERNKKMELAKEGISYKSEIIDNYEAKQRADLQQSEAQEPAGPVQFIAEHYGFLRSLNQDEFLSRLTDADIQFLDRKRLRSAIREARNKQVGSREQRPEGIGMSVEYLLNYEAQKLHEANQDQQTIDEFFNNLTSMDLFNIYSRYVAEQQSHVEVAQLRAYINEAVDERVPGGTDADTVRELTEKMNERIFAEVSEGADPNIIVNQLDEYIENIIETRENRGALPESRALPAPETPSTTLSVDNPQGIVDYLKEMPIGEPRTVGESQQYAKHGILEYPIGEYAVARVSQNRAEDDHMKVNFVYFIVDYVGVGADDTDFRSLPIEIYHREKLTKNGKAFIDAARQKITTENLSDVFSAPGPTLTDAAKVISGVADEPQQEPTPSSGNTGGAVRPIPDDSESVSVPPETSEQNSQDDGGATYHGATFTEENGKLSITGDAIPESFWDYYHSGGRNRNSAHKRAMKEAGWQYTYSGSKPRIYTFSITVDNFNKWRAENPDDSGVTTPVEVKTPEPPKDDAETQTKVKQAIVDAIEEGNYETVDDKIEVGVEGLGTAVASVSVTGTSSYMPGAGMTETTYKMNVYIHAKERPIPFKAFSIDAPEAIMEKYFDMVREGGLNDLQDPEQWERIGRKNAWLHEKTGATFNLAKDGNTYKATFSNLPNAGVQFVTVRGDTLQARFEQAIAELHPYMFQMPNTNVLKIIDTLRADLGKETDNADVESDQDVSQTETPVGDSEVSPTETEDAFILGTEEKKAMLTHITEKKVDRAKSETGEHKFTMFGNKDFLDVNITVTRSPIMKYEAGLFGTEEPVRGDEGWKIEFASDMFVDPIAIQVDLNQLQDPRYQDEIGFNPEHDADYLEERLAEDKQEVAVEMAQRLITEDMLKPVAEYAAALGIIGSVEWQDFRAMTTDQQLQYLQDRENYLMESSGDMTMTDEQIHAANFLRTYVKERMTVSGGAPIVQTPETVLNVPDLEPYQPKKKGWYPAITRLTAKLDGFTPKMKIWLERTRREYFSGYKNLATMGPAGMALRAAAEHALDIQDRGSTLDLRRLEPNQKALRALVKARTPEGADTEIVHGRISKQIWDFVEHNTPIDDAEVAEVAKGWKDAWREIYLEHVVNMLQLRKEVESLNSGERVVIRRSDGSIQKEWVPLLPDHVYNEDKDMFEDADGNMLPVEEAIRKADKLYLPHRYPSSHWNAITSEISGGIIAKLDKALQSKGSTIPGFKYSKANKSWTFTRTGDMYTSKAEAVQGAKDYWNEAYVLAQNMLDEKRASVIGRYGNLEVAREANDKLYMRDISLLVDHVQHFWRRVGEIAVWGQFDPVLGKYPRLALYTARIGETSLDKKEQALYAIASTLMEHDSGMFEKLPSFREGESTATSIIQYWNTPDINKMMIDNPDAFTPEVLDTLQEIGLIEREGDGYKLTGENEDVQMTNFVRHFVPYFQAIHLREETALKVARGIGHWEHTDDLNTNSSRFWSAVSHITTTMTLGLGTSVQNLGEIPLVSTLTGSKALAQAFESLINDEEFRRMAPQLSGGLNLAMEYMADDNVQSKYLTWTLFKPTERWSRVVGVVAGWKAAENAIQDYLDNPSKTTRYRLEELKISVATIDNYRSLLGTGEVPNFTDLVAEAKTRIADGDMLVAGLQRPNADPPSSKHVDWIGDEMAKAARYVSVRVFKGYNALSLPNFLTRRDALIRTLGKFKSWAAQMHEFMWDTFGKARTQAMQGNWGPAWRLAQGFVAMGLSAGMIGAFFNWAAGRDDDTEGLGRVMEAIAMAHTLGTASMMLEIYLWADGNPYRANQLINSAFGSPTAGVLARVGADLFAGDLSGAAEATFTQLPGIREVKRFGGGAYRAATK